MQRVLPDYRAPFFEALASACTRRLSIFTGKPRAGEMVTPVTELKQAHLESGRNIHLLGGRLYICIQIGLMKWLKEWDPDVLIVEANPRYLRTPAAVRWMHTRNRPVIGWGLGAPVIEGRGAVNTIRRHYREKFIRQFDSLITYSQIGAEEYMKLGFPQERVFVAHNAVTPRPTHPLPQRTLPDGEQPARVLFVGRLQARKQVGNLIEACARLPLVLQPELVIVGDGPARQRWETMAKNLYPSTSFTGALMGKTLEDQFLKADLFVLPGTGGLAIQQAMSYGLPVIAAEADGTQADLVRNENGWQVPPNDTKALQAALESALADIPTLRRMGAESYRIVDEEINLEKMVEVFIDAINRSVS